jgi:hypothetical protein
MSDAYPVRAKAQFLVLRSEMRFVTQKARLNR